MKLLRNIEQYWNIYINYSALILIFPSNMYKVEMWLNIATQFSFNGMSLMKLMFKC